MDNLHTHEDSTPLVTRGRSSSIGPSGPGEAPRSGVAPGLGVLQRGEVLPLGVDGLGEKELLLRSICASLTSGLSSSSSSSSVCCMGPHAGVCAFAGAFVYGDGDARHVGGPAKPAKALMTAGVGANKPGDGDGALTGTAGEDVRWRRKLSDACVTSTVGVTRGQRHSETILSSPAT